MGAVTIQQMADRVAGLMEERLGVGGTGLSAKMRRGGRLLPRKVRAAAQRLADAAERAQNPKLLVQVDLGAVSADYDICVRHLGSLGAKRGLGGLILSAAATLALGLLVLGLVWLYIRWSQGGLP
jgi:hypothetical protein